MASKKKSGKKPAAKRRPGSRRRPATRKAGRRQSRRPWVSALIFLLLGVVVAVGIMFLARPESAPPFWQRLRRQLTAALRPGPTPSRPTGRRAPAPAAKKEPRRQTGRQGKKAAGKRLVLTIYQADQDYAELVKWRQPLTGHPDRQQLARKIFSLLNRDSSRGKSPLPPGVRLRRVTFRGDVITVDLSPEIVSGLAHSGSTDEMLAVYGLVNSFLANFPGYRRVQLTVNGRVIPTLAGHIETLQPLVFWRER